MSRIWGQRVANGRARNLGGAGQILDGALICQEVELSFPVIANDEHIDVVGRNVGDFLLPRDLGNDQINERNSFQKIFALVVAEVALLALFGVEGICREADNEEVPARLRLLEQANVAIVQRVECAVGEHSRHQMPFGSVAVQNLVPPGQVRAHLCNWQPQWLSRATTADPVYGLGVRTGIAIVIPARNDAAALPAAVASVVAQRGVTIDEVVIAVGPSEDETNAVANALANEHDIVRVVENPTGRTPNGLNLAIAATSAPVVVRVDARSVLPNEYVKFAIESMEATGAGNVGAVQVPVGATSTQRAIAAAMRSGLGSGGAAYRTATERRKVDTAYLGVFKREALEAVGRYDETFTRNQDAELNERLNRAGHEVWLDPRMAVDYYPRSTIAGLARQFWQYGWWRLRTARKHRGSLRPRQLAVVALVGGLLIALVAAAVVNPWFLLPVVAYGALVLGAGLFAGDTVGERLLVPVALIIMHVTWAAGFVTSAIASVGRADSNSGELQQ